LATAEDDIRHDDLEYNPALEPQSSKAWLNLLQESETAFEDYNDHCDKIDKQFASLQVLGDELRMRRFAMFWANSEVIRPAIYAKAPVPVVTTKFHDRRPVYEAAAEVLERCCVAAFDLAYINEVMLQIRDDLALRGRGVPWCRYEAKSNDGSYYDTERVCIDFKHRRDFLHSVSRCWYEVTWVAAASYLTRAEARERFYPTSGLAYQEAEYAVDKDAKEVGGADARERAKFWEIWDKKSRRVIWVAQGCEDILDEAAPHLDIQGFFPCPKPAYGTCQPGSLVPVPDVMQYRDQLDELNLLTGRIHALSDSLEAKGFYPAGGAELSDAIQAALKRHEPGRILVPISNWAAFGGSKETIVWLPIDQIATTIQTCVELRKEIIQDIYQITGLSDIMRGETDPRETMGAQQLKTQYGSTRVRDKQYELVRVARDLVCITADIICQKFADTTIVEMSQTLLPNQDMQRATVAQLTQQLNQQAQQLMQSAQQPQMRQMGQSNPDQVQQAAASAQQQIASMQQMITIAAQQPTVEQVLALFKDRRARSFILDIETDSTIYADEQQAKADVIEFVTGLAQLLPQLAQMITALPGAAPFCGDVLKFATKEFRAGRELIGSIDNLVEVAKQQASAAGSKEDPTVSTNRTALQIEQIKAQRETERDRSTAQLKAQELQLKDKHTQMEIASRQQIEMLKLQGKAGDDQGKLAAANQKAMHDRQAHQMDMAGKQADMQLDRQKLAMALSQAAAKQQDMQMRQRERQSAQAFRQQQAAMRPPGGGSPPPDGAL